MAFGNMGMGGAYYSKNYDPDASPPVPPPTPLQQAMLRARDFGTQTSYRLPNGKFVTHVYDPFTGNIRQLIEESRSSSMADRMNLMAYEAGLQEDRMMMNAALDAMRPHPQRVG